MALDIFWARPPESYPGTPNGDLERSRRDDDDDGDDDDDEDEEDDDDDASLPIVVALPG